MYDLSTNTKYIQIVHFQGHVQQRGRVAGRLADVTVVAAEPEHPQDGVADSAPVAPGAGDVAARAPGPPPPAPPHPPQATSSS